MDKYENIITALSLILIIMNLKYFVHAAYSTSQFIHESFFVVAQSLFSSALSQLRLRVQGYAHSLTLSKLDS